MTDRRDGDGPGGFFVPMEIPWIEESLRVDLARMARNAKAEMDARLAGETTYLREGFLGKKTLVPVPPLPAPPTRRERFERSLVEARRRIRAAVYVLRTGDTGCDDYDD